MDKRRLKKHISFLMKQNYSCCKIIMHKNEEKCCVINSLKSVSHGCGHYSKILISYLFTGRLCERFNRHFCQISTLPTKVC